MRVKREIQVKQEEGLNGLAVRRKELQQQDQ